MDKHIEHLLATFGKPEHFDSLPKSAITGKPVLHFAHANGFVAATYQPILDILSQIFSIEIADKLGTHPHYPPNDHWQNLTRQVADSIDDACRKHSVPTVVALGHSLGAVTTLQALLANPKPISHAILLDPSLLMGKLSLTYQIAKYLDKGAQKIHTATAGKLARFTAKLHDLNNKYGGKSISSKLSQAADKWQNLAMFEPHYFIDKYSPAARSKYRRDTFDSRQHAYDNLRNKPLFAAFDERCFSQYIRHGFTENDDGTVSLTIAKQSEVDVFHTIPSWYWYKSIRPVRPVRLIVGVDSHFSHFGSYRTLSENGLDVLAVAGSHMFALEHPDACAAFILQSLAQFLQEDIE